MILKEQEATEIFLEVPAGRPVKMTGAGARSLPSSQRGGTANIMNDALVI